MKVYRFHQFVRIEDGPVNSALINFLTGDIYHVENKDLKKFNEGRYNEIEEFMDFCREEKLVIEVGKSTWIPYLTFKPLKINTDDPGSFKIKTLEIEEGVDLELIRTCFTISEVERIFYYGDHVPDVILPGVPVIQKKKTPESCEILSKIDGNFMKISEKDFLNNMMFNSCWAGRAAITSDGIVRPCIYSTIGLGRLDKESMDGLIGKLAKHWSITKDKVSTCKSCEFKFVCFDCRENSYRKTRDLLGHNPNCNYNPHKGIFTV